MGFWQCRTVKLARLAGMLFSCNPGNFCCPCNFGRETFETTLDLALLWPLLVHTYLTRLVYHGW